MNKELLIGSSNKGKIKEFIFYINHFKIFQDYKLILLSSFIDLGEPNEDQSTFAGNAVAKSSFYFNRTKVPTISDDSGFIINDGSNFPGIRTARYAKGMGSFEKAIKSLFLVRNSPSFLPATFFCSLSYVEEEKQIFADGKIKGRILLCPKGHTGFGYDPFFIPSGNDKTFAEMSFDNKMLVSHRHNAFKEMSLKIN